MANDTAKESEIERQATSRPMCLTRGSVTCHTHAQMSGCSNQEEQPPTPNSMVSANPRLQLIDGQPFHNS